MVVALLALLIAASGAAVAAIPSNGTITACYAKSNGALRVIDTGQTCTAKETLLAWMDGSTLLGKNEKATDSDKLDNKDSTEFLGANQTAADSDKLDGKDSSEFQPSDPCPDGTLFHEGACIVTISRGPAAFPNAEGVCLQAGRRLPTVAELQTFRLRQDLSGAEFTSHVSFDANGSSQTQKVMLVDQAGSQSVASGSAPFRCVAAPNAARSENNPLEAAAQSDLRKAVAAANLCAAGNDGSYASCGTIAQLEANGCQHDSNVTLVITEATATRWVAQAQHNSGGSAYRYDTDTAQIVPIPRF
jgi:hypothetical protein